MNILPLASAISPADRVRSAVTGISRQLDSHGVAHRIIEADAGAPSVLLVVTGGTEHLALAALEHMSGPAVLLAHPEQNSLPAALEILARLRQSGRTGRIVLLNESEDGYRSLLQLVGILATHTCLASMRLGRIGRPSDWLVGSTPDPDLITSTWGPAVVDVPIEALVAAIDSAPIDEVEAILGDFVQGATAVTEPDPGDLLSAARVAAALRHLVHDERLDGCTVRCFDLVTGKRTTGCLALSWLLDQGIVAGCEGDLPATLTMAWLQAMTGRPSFMANPQDLDRQANTMTCAHCTIARSMVSQYALRSHFESSLGVGIQGQLDLGDATLARIGGAELRDLFVSDAAVVAGSHSELRCRTQVRLRLVSDVGDLLTRPLGNHHVVAQGHWAARLRDYHDLYVSHTI
jgi:L-fucose isomerase-like protein